MSEVRRHRIRVRGGELAVADHGPLGDGEPLLLLHGLPARGTLWDDVIPPLARRRRVVVPDLVGFGDSTRDPGAPVHAPLQVAYLLDALDHLGIDRVRVVGQGLGGAIGQILAVDHHARVGGLVLQHAVTHGEWPTLMARHYASARWFLRYLPRHPVLAVLERQLVAQFEHVDRAGPYVRSWLAPFRASATGFRTLVDHAEALDELHTSGRTPRLGELDVPLDLVWSTARPHLGLERAERIVRDAPGAVLHRVDRGGIFLAADAPDETVAAIEAHLKR